MHLSILDFSVPDFPYSPAFSWYTAVPYPPNLCSYEELLWKKI